MLKKDREYQFEESIEWRLRMAKERGLRVGTELQQSTMHLLINDLVNRR